MSGKIFWAGDSTVKENDFTTYPQTGIGQGMSLFIKKEVVIINHAENGRSTKSFIDESRLAKIYNDLREGDFLFIQFGHNDEKIEDPNRYCEAYGEYQENLERFINVARNRKAYPLLITPLCRRLFNDELHIQEDVHGDYPSAMLEVGKKLDVPCIDLCALSKELIEKMGMKESKKWFMHLDVAQYANYPEGLEDNTHIRYEGAVAFAQLIAKELKQLGGVFRELLIQPEKV